MLTGEERLVVWTLLDTGLRVGDSTLSRDNIDWQGHRLMIYGKGGPYGTKSKRHIIPLTARVRPLIEGHFALHDAFGVGDRSIQRIVKRVANRARIRNISLPSLQRLVISARKLLRASSSAWRTERASEISHCRLCNGFSDMTT